MFKTVDFPATVESINIGVEGKVPAAVESLGGGRESSCNCRVIGRWKGKFLQL